MQTQLRMHDKLKIFFNCLNILMIIRKQKYTFKLNEIICLYFFDFFLTFAAAVLRHKGPTVQSTTAGIFEVLLSVIILV